MANPIFIPAVFAANGIKNVIQKTRQALQDVQDFTWNDGAPSITMIPIDSGGKAPKGQDFNGVLNALSEHSVFKQNGGRYLWTNDVITNYGGYAKDTIVTADNGVCDYKSLIDNNTSNPNTQSPLRDWMIYSGEGSVYPASSTVAGMLKVLNILTSTDVASALSANMGRVLALRDIGVDQTWQNVTAERLLGNGTSVTPIFSTWINTTGRPIQIQVSGQGQLSLTVAGVDLARSGSNEWSSGGSRAYSFVTAIIPPNATYKLGGWSNVIGSTVLWTELR